MNSRPSDLPTTKPFGGWPTGLAVAAVLVVAFVAISGRSLWIDEACTATKVVPPTLGGWWQALSQDRSADQQMPLYMFYVWGWAKLFGPGEWGLHSANVPWFLAGALAFILAFPPGDRRRVPAACAVLLCPFAWYYLDEARPYTMQLGATLMMVGALVRLTRDSSGFHVACFLFGLVVLSGSSLLGMVWAGGALAAMPALLSLPRVVSLARRYWYLWLAAGGLLVVLACYYLWSLSLGARASVSATITWGSVGFVGYELLGFGGLGPGRLELRTAGLAALRPYLVWLAPYGAAIGIVLGAALLHEVKGGIRRHLVLALCCVVPPAFILTVGCVAHFRALGRHFAPVVPVLLLLSASGLAWLWSRHRAWARVVALAFCVLSLLSCLSLRFSPRHEKDNYRAAAALARSALSKGKLVWWNAASVGAQYYDVPLTSDPGRGGAALLVLNPARGTLSHLPLPQVIIASKPDLYDGQSTLAELLSAEHFQPAAQLNAFVIWERRGP